MARIGQVAGVDMRLGEGSPDRGRWPPLLMALRQATRPDAARVAAFVTLGRPPGGWAGYREFLAIHHGWIAALDRRLVEAAPLHGLPFSGRLLPLLDRGLFMAAVPYAATTAPANILPLRSRAEALGYLYVYEGFRLGCRVLARQVRQLGIELGTGGAVLAGLGTGTREAWLRLAGALGRTPVAEHPVVIASATELFRRWEDWLRPQARGGEGGEFMVAGGDDADLDGEDARAADRRTSRGWRSSSTPRQAPAQRRRGRWSRTRPGAIRPAWSGQGSGDGEIDGEDAPPPGQVMGADLAADRLDGLAGDGEAEPEAGPIAPAPVAERA